MKVKALAMMAGVGCAMLFAASAQATLVGITFEKDPFSLDKQTLLADIPGYAGQSVYNIYAQFTNPQDQAVGVVGTPTNPFHVFTQNGGNFFNVPSAQGGSNVPPTAFAAGFNQLLNLDSFFTVGVKFQDDFYTGDATALVIAPNTPGPNGNSWGGGVIGMNMAWTLPPTIGVPPVKTPETLAGNDQEGQNRVLLMRLTVENQEKAIEGQFGLLWFDGDSGVGSETGVTFKTVAIPAPGALALLGLAGLAGVSRRRRG